jgi:hypothetical protein
MGRDIYSSDFWLLFSIYIAIESQPLSGSQPDGFIIFPELSNSMSHPAEQGFIQEKLHLYS